MTIEIILNCIQNILDMVLDIICFLFMFDSSLSLNTVYAAAILLI